MARHCGDDESASALEHFFMYFEKRYSRSCLCVLNEYMQLKALKTAAAQLHVTLATVRHNELNFNDLHYCISIARAFYCSLSGL